MDGLHYIDYDPEKIWDEMHRTYLDCGGDVLYPGDEKEILLRAALAMAEAVMAKVDSALRMDTLTYATGDYLKEYGLKRGCVYMEAVAAEAPVAIAFRSTGREGTLPAGTAMTADGLTAWELTADVTYSGREEQKNAVIRCRTPGAAGNGLYEGAQMQLLSRSDAVESVTVTAQASGGTDAEDEEAYRERVRTWGLATVTTGPSGIYESRAMAVSADILDAKAVEDSALTGGQPGDVGVYLICREGTYTAQLEAAVLAALSPEDVRPLTDRVAVHEAEEKEYTISVRVTYDAYRGLTADIADIVADYQAWQENTVGRAYNPDRLAAALYQAGCVRVEFLEGSGMDGDNTYTEIGDRARCKGTVTWEVA